MCDRTKKMDYSSGHGLGNIENMKVYVQAPRLFESAPQQLASVYDCQALVRLQGSGMFATRTLHIHKEFL
jgi:hypothetical protein